MFFDHNQRAYPPLGHADHGLVQLVDDKLRFAHQAADEFFGEDIPSADMLERPADFGLEEHHGQDHARAEQGIEQPAEGGQLHAAAHERGDKEHADALEHLVGSRFLGKQDELIEQQRDDKDIYRVRPQELVHAARYGLYKHIRQNRITGLSYNIAGTQNPALLLYILPPSPARGDGQCLQFIFDFLSALQPPVRGEFFPYP